MTTETKATFGLDSFDTAAGAETGAAMEVRSPNTGEVMLWPDGRPWTINFLGSDSAKVVDLARKQSDRRSQAMMRTRQPQNTAAMEKDNIELLVAATQSWDIPLGDGTPAKSEPNEYRTAYAKYRWLYEQGNEFVGNRGNFLKA